LAACIDRGLDLVRPEQEALRRHVEVVVEVAATLDPADGRCGRREDDFEELLGRLDGDDGPIPAHLAGVMRSFRPGLFAGGDAADRVRDNLDLERWFRLPKRHERRIHGRCHAGVRIVQEGPSLAPTLDAHAAHPEPFRVEDLFPYRSARVPAGQVQAMGRRKVMRKARSKKRRPLLLAELERRYLDYSCLSRSLGSPSITPE
jgi:hypothetical protein